MIQLLIKTFMNSAVTLYVCVCVFLFIILFQSFIVSTPTTLSLFSAKPNFIEKGVLDLLNNVIRSVHYV